MAKMKKVTAHEIMSVVRLRINRDNTRVALYHWLIASLTKYIGKPINNRTITYLEKLLADPKTAPVASDLRVRLEYSGVGSITTAKIRFYGITGGREYYHDYGFVFDIIRDKDGNYNEALTVAENSKWIDRVVEDYHKNAGLRDKEIAQSLADRYNETARMIEAWKDIVGDTALNYALNFNIDNELENALQYREYGKPV